MTAADCHLLGRWIAARMRLTLRKPRALVFTFAFPLVLVMLFSALNGNAEVATPYGGRRPLRAVLHARDRGLRLVTACYTTLVIGLATARDDGLLKRVRGTPLPMSIYLGSWLTGAALIGIAAVCCCSRRRAGVRRRHLRAHAARRGRDAGARRGVPGLARRGARERWSRPPTRRAARAAHVPADLVHLGHLVPAQRRAGLAESRSRTSSRCRTWSSVQRLLRAGRERRQSTSPTSLARDLDRGRAVRRGAAVPLGAVACAGMLVPERGRLPDLSAQLRGRRRGRDRRPARDHAAPRPPRGARRRRALALAGLPLAAGRRGLRHQRLPGHRPGLRDARGLRRAARGRARARHEADHGPRRQPHLRRAPLVRRVALHDRQPQARLVLVARGADERWRSCFSGPAWELDAATGEYYLHLFSRRQPDLNWENPEVRQAVYAMMRWWLDRGRRRLPHGRHQPDLQAARAARRHRRAVRRTGRGSTSSCRRCTARCSPGRDGLLTVGEMPGVTVEEARLFTDPARGELDMVFHFEHVQLDQGPTRSGTSGRCSCAT